MRITRIGFAARTPIDPAWRRDDPPLRRRPGQLGEYFAGERRAFDLPLAPAGTPFQRQVWAALAAIPYGETTSSPALAERLGQPGSPGPWAPPTGPTRWPSSCPATGWWAPTAPSPATPAGSTPAPTLLALEGHRFSTGTGSMPSPPGWANPNTWA